MPSGAIGRSQEHTRAFSGAIGRSQEHTRAFTGAHSGVHRSHRAFSGAHSGTRAHSCCNQAQSGAIGCNQVRSGDAHLVVLLHDLDTRDRRVLEISHELVRECLDVLQHRPRSLKVSLEEEGRGEVAEDLGGVSMQAQW